jgi:hypothetical protein
MHSAGGPACRLRVVYLRQPIKNQSTNEFKKRTRGEGRQQSNTREGERDPMQKHYIHREREKERERERERMKERERERERETCG